MRLPTKHGAICTRTASPPGYRCLRTCKGAFPWWRPPLQMPEQTHYHPCALQRERHHQRPGGVSGCAEGAVRGGVLPCPCKCQSNLTNAPPSNLPMHPSNLPMRTAARTASPTAWRCFRMCRRGSAWWHPTTTRTCACSRQRATSSAFFLTCRMLPVHVCRARACVCACACACACAYMHACPHPSTAPTPLNPIPKLTLTLTLNPYPFTLTLTLALTRTCTRPRRLVTRWPFDWAVNFATVQPGGSIVAVVGPCFGHAPPWQAPQPHHHKPLEGWSGSSQSSCENGWQ